MGKPAVIPGRGRWALTVRSGPRVERSRFRTAGDALDALEARAQELAGTAERQEVKFLARRIEPAAQVAVRLEIAGPWRAGSPRAGVDLRGDGSAEAYTGRVQRRLIEQRRGESAVAALRRVLAPAVPPRAT